MTFTKKLPGVMVPRVNPDFLLEPMEDEMVLCHPAGRRAIYLNQTATLILGLCNGQRSVQEIKDLLIDAYDMDPQLIEKQLADTFQMLTDYSAVSFLPRG